MRAVANAACFVCSASLTNVQITVLETAPGDILLYLSILVSRSILHDPA
jgi:hypothetical protein